MLSVLCCFQDRVSDPHRGTGIALRARRHQDEVRSGAKALIKGGKKEWLKPNLLQFSTKKQVRSCWQATVLERSDAR